MVDFCLDVLSSMISGISSSKEVRLGSVEALGVALGSMAGFDDVLSD